MTLQIGDEVKNYPLIAEDGFTVSTSTQRRITRRG